MSAQGKFTGKTVYVIGASHGIGEEIARRSPPTAPKS